MLQLLISPPFKKTLERYVDWRDQIKEIMPEWTSETFLTIKKGQWIGLFIVFLISILIFLFLKVFIYKIINKKLKKDIILNSKFTNINSVLPFALFGATCFFQISLSVLEFNLLKNEFIMRSSYVLSSIYLVWSLLVIVDLIGLHFEEITKSSANKFDDVLIPMLKTTFKVIILSLGILLITHNLSFDVAGLLAGFGIGGVAVAFAAKDTIANLFGSVTVLIDRPFQMGDYVLLEKNLEGTIEQVGFRSTRIRTPYNSLVTLPNSLLANMPIDNYGMRKVRRYKTLIEVSNQYAIEKVEEFCNQIKYIIQLNPIIQRETSSVSIYEIKPSGIDILVTVFFVTELGTVELQERHKLILEILKIANYLKIEIAKKPMFELPRIN